MILSHRQAAKVAAAMETMSNHSSPPVPRRPSWAEHSVVSCHLSLVVARLPYDNNHCRMVWTVLKWLSHCIMWSRMTLIKRSNSYYSYITFKLYMLFLSSWYHGSITREEAEVRLKQAGVNCFLIRTSTSQSDGYALSMRYWLKLLAYTFTECYNNNCWYIVIGNCNVQ